MATTVLAALLVAAFLAAAFLAATVLRLTVAGLMNYVYERDYAVLVRLKVPADARGTVPIRAEAHWLEGELDAARREAELAHDVCTTTNGWLRGAVAVWLRRLGGGRLHQQRADGGLSRRRAAGGRG